MNEQLSVVIKKRVALNCCNEEKKCEVCKPLWQRTLALDESCNLWFPIVGMNNEMLRRIADLNLGLLIDAQSGVWYVEEALAFEITGDDKVGTVIKEIARVIKEKYQEELMGEHPEFDEIR